MNIKRECDFDANDCRELLKEAIIAKAPSILGQLGEGESFVVQLNSWGTACVFVEKKPAEVANV